VSDEWDWLPGIVQRTTGEVVDVMIAHHRSIPTAFRFDGLRDLNNEPVQLGVGDVAMVKYEEPAT